MSGLLAEKLFPISKGAFGMDLSFKKLEAQKSAKGLGAWGAGFKTKARASRTRGALLPKKMLKVIPKPYLLKIN